MSWEVDYKDLYSQQPVILLGLLMCLDMNLDPNSEDIISNCGIWWSHKDRTLVSSRGAEVTRGLGGSAADGQEPASGMHTRPPPLPGDQWCRDTHPPHLSLVKDLLALSCTFSVEGSGIPALWCQIFSSSLLVKRYKKAIAGYNESDFTQRFYRKNENFN